jgi:AraC family transcriptional regulator of adaptative response/methylated-DNA-[protein]-cysteine methyltransferase
MDINLNLFTNTQEETLRDETLYWDAVQNRDARFNGIFVYAVRSTGIYCRPTCPSRRPHREQVVFFNSFDEAEAASFRPCRRCQPRAAFAPDDQAEIVRQACQLLDEHLAEPLTLNELGEKLHLSSSYLHRIFRAITGLTPHQYALGKHVEKFKAGLKDGKNVTTALYDAGFSSSSRLYEGAAGRLGMTPTAYRRGGQGMRIHYTIVDTYLGRMLVAATAQGICAISFDDEDAELEAFLRAEYPAAQVERDPEGMETWIQALLAHLEGEQPGLALPLDLQATAFQQRVWAELRKIPYGETRSYSQVAGAIGQPTAVRAVAQACASNPVVLVTPCHRVVRSDGSLGGYRWGIRRKRALLERERGQKSVRPT